MTIPPFAAGSYGTDRTTASLLGLKSRLDRLTTQLGTGRAAQSYAELGSARGTALNARAAIGALDGYVSAAAGGATRVSLATQSLTQLSTLGNTLRTSIVSDLRVGTTTGIANSVGLARSNLEAAVEALNQQAAGQYLFGGRATDAAPVVPAARMLDGDASAGLAGLRTLVAEQKAADLGGADAPGRIALGVSGASLALEETGTAQTRANFGFRLLSASSSNAGAIAVPDALQQKAAAGSAHFSLAAPPQAGERIRIALNDTDGSQRLVDLTVRAEPDAGAQDQMPVFSDKTQAEAWLDARFGSQGVASAQASAAVGIELSFAADTAGRAGLSVTGTPQAGDTVTIALGLRDGTQRVLTLTAAAAAPDGASDRFTVGASPEATAANLAATLGRALRAAAGTDLAASSATRAAADFFSGSPSAGLAPRRVVVGADGDPAYAATASAATVIWYRGDDAADDPRATASILVGADRAVAVGARANEAPIRATLAAFGVLAAGEIRDTAGAVDSDRYRALAERAQRLVTPAEGRTSVAEIAGAFGIASHGLGDAKAQAQASRATLQTALDGVETVSTEAVAADLLSLQNRLQASYQVTAMLSKLRLVNYLS